MQTLKSSHYTTNQLYTDYNPPLGIKAILSLQFFIQEQRLTDCLELLENHGYTGDSAIFVLASLQLQGDAA